MNRRQMDRSQSRDFMTLVNYEMTMQDTKSKRAVIIIVCASAARAHVGAILFQTPMIHKERISIALSIQKETQHLRNFSDSWTQYIFVPL
jgi:hypothetical protein